MKIVCIQTCLGGPSNHMEMLNLHKIFLKWKCIKLSKISLILQSTSQQMIKLKVFFSHFLIVVTIEHIEQR